MVGRGGGRKKRSWNGKKGKSGPTRFAACCFGGQGFTVRTRESLAEHFCRGGDFLLENTLVLLLLGVGLESLPRQRATQEIHEHVAKRLEVVASRLLDAHMRVDGRIPCSTRQVFALSIGNVPV